MVILHNNKDIQAIRIWLITSLTSLTTFLLLFCFLSIDSISLYCHHHHHYDHQSRQQNKAFIHSLPALYSPHLSFFPSLFPFFLPLLTPWTITAQILHPLSSHSLLSYFSFFPSLPVPLYRYWHHRHNRDHQLHRDKSLTNGFISPPGRHRVKVTRTPNDALDSWKKNGSARFKSHCDYLRFYRYSYCCCHIHCVMSDHKGTR